MEQTSGKKNSGQTKKKVKSVQSTKSTKPKKNTEIPENQKKTEAIRVVKDTAENTDRKTTGKKNTKKKTSGKKSGKKTSQKPASKYGLPIALAAVLITCGAVFAGVHAARSSEKTEDTATQKQISAEKTDILPEEGASEPAVQPEAEPETVPETEAPTEPDPLNPQFSPEPGFYASQILLSLSSDTGTAIYYTTDGSTPTTESELYTGPVTIQSREGEENYIASRSDTSVEPLVVTEPVDKATVIRAIAVDAAGNVSDIITHTYFVGLDQAKDYNNVHVVSIALDESSLFDYETGIYCKGAVYDNIGRSYSGYFIPCNYTKKGKDWEREAGVEIFDSEGNSIASQEMGVRIMGGTSRNSVQKTLKLFAREEYGAKKLECNLFPGLVKEIDETDDIKKFNTFVIRNGGDDRHGTKFRDAFIQRLIADRAVSTQYTEPAIGFLNGEYAGVYNLQEDYSAYYVQTHFGVPKDDVIMVKTEELEEGNDSDYAFFEDLSDFVNEEDLSDDAVYAEYCKMMDIDSLIDYFAFELWIENNDWIDVENNYRLWRSRTDTGESSPYQDGKWRWCVYDTEYSMGCDRQGKPEGKSRLLEALIDCRSDIGVNFFVQPLLHNETFRAQFVTTFMDICNSCFETEHALAVLDEMYENDYAPILNQSFRRTGPDWRIDSDENMTAYTEKVLGYEKTFIEGRTEACIDMLTDCLDLSGETAEITVSINDTSLGTVQIGTVQPEWKTSSWKGTYFTDYPVTLTAVPNEGSTFNGWTGSGISPADAKNLTITVPVTEAAKFTASFS